MAHSRAVLAFALLAGLVAWGRPAAANPMQAGETAQNPSTVPANAAAQITQVSPDQASAGSQVTVQITGQDFSAGAYVSFSTPDVRVVSTRRVSATEMEATLEVRPGATPGPATLYVSNPAGAVAQTAFQILPGAAPPTPPAAVTPAPPPALANAPKVNSVKPTSASAGSQVELKIKGKNFAPGAQVSFSNPGITVVSTKVVNTSELEVSIQVATGASAGKTGLFVVNPDDTEVEASFEVTGGAAATGSAPGAATTSKGQPASAQEQKFEVYNLGDAATIFKNPTQSKGTLIVSGGKLRYEEGGKVVFTAAPADIQEIGLNVVFGLNTGTFHVILKSSKTYNFVSTSLRPADTQAMVDALRKALQMNQ